MSSTKNPLVSVLMTVYNREKYIAQAIESVIQSTYSNWELIIVDDGSKDRSMDIAYTYANEDSRIHIHINNSNLGDYPNRNQAASYAKGEYLKYVDADDKIYPHGLEMLIYFMEQFPKAGYGLCSLGQDNSRIYPYELDPQQAYFKHYLTGNHIFHKAPLSSIIRRKAFEEIGGFTGKRMVGDFEMWNLISRNKSVVLMPKGIVWYRIHSEGEMQFARDNAQQLFEYYTLEEELLNSDLCPLSKNEREKAIDKCLRKQARFILRHLKSFDFNLFYSLKKLSNLSTFEIILKGLQKA
jgi:glycosyltransferase involved in cell wall biosynthesis